MPLFSENELVQNSTQRQGTVDLTPQADPNAPGWVDTAVASFKDTNSVANILQAVHLGDDRTFDPSFDPLEKLKAERPDLQQHITNFTNVRNEEHYNRKIDQIDYENEVKETIARGPTSAAIIGGLAGGGADPLMLIPMVGAATKAASAARVIGSFAGNTMIGAAAQEGVLQATQETRPVRESVINVLAAGAFGGILGAGVAALSPGARKAGEALMEAALNGKDIDHTPIVEAIQRGGSLSAAEAPSRLEDQGLAYINETVAKYLGGAEFMRAPDLRAITSPSTSVRDLGEVFYNSNYIRAKNVDGIATKANAQNAVFRWDQKVLSATKEIDELYANHLETGGVRAALAQFTNGLPEGKVKMNEFNHRVWKTLTDADYEDAIPQVKQAAARIRSGMDEITREMQALKMLPEDLDPELMKTYMTRAYDLDKLSSTDVSHRFVKKVGGWLENNHTDGKPREVPMNSLDAQERARNILDTIKGDTDKQLTMSMMAEDFISKGKFTKERVLMIPDREIEEFLRTDAMESYRTYMMKGARMVETQKALERARFPDFQSVIRRIRREADMEVQKLPDTPEGIAQAAKITKEFRDQEDLAKMMYRSMMGQIAKPIKADSVMSSLRTLQAARLLGGVTLSSLPDLVATPFRMGLGRTLRDAWFPAVRSLKSLKASTDQLADISGALEFEQNNILRALGGEDELERMGLNRGAWDKSMQLLGATNMNVTGLKHWTNMNRRLATQAASADLMRTITKGPEGRQIERLASLGIDKADFAAIAEQVNKYADTHEGTYFMNPHLWDNKDALDKVKSAIQIDVDSAILRPSVETLPFIVQESSIAKTLFQFKSFGAAATGKVLISGIQRRDATALLGLLNLVVLGAATEVVKDTISGRDVEYTPEGLIAAGVSRSGVAGLVGTTALDFGRTLFGEGTSRYGESATMGIAFGPTAGLLADGTKTLTKWTDGEANQQDLETFAKLWPFQNLFYLRAIGSRVFGEE